MRFTRCTFIATLPSIMSNNNHNNRNHQRNSGTDETTRSGAGRYDDGVSSMSSEFWSRPQEQFYDEPASANPASHPPSELFLPAVPGIKRRKPKRGIVPGCLARILPTWVTQAPLFLKVFFVGCLIMITVALSLIVIKAAIRNDNEATMEDPSTGDGDPSYWDEDDAQNPPGVSGRIPTTLAPSMQPTSLLTERIQEDEEKSMEELFDSAAPPTHSPRTPSPTKPVRGSPLATQTTAPPTVYAPVLVEEEDSLPVANVFTKDAGGKDKKKRDSKENDTKEKSSKKDSREKESEERPSTKEKSSRKKTDAKKTNSKKSASTKKPNSSKDKRSKKEKDSSSEEDVEEDNGKGRKRRWRR